MRSSHSARIRPYRSSDRTALYAVALATGDDGEDASELFHDPELVGHRYVGPYLDLEPGLAFTLEDTRGPCGYVLGTADTESFHRRFVREWLPPLLTRMRARPPIGSRSREEEQLLAELRSPSLTVPRDLEVYPAHLHIDVLPRVQRRGHGRRLIETLLDALVERGCKGVHLGVGPRNERAQGFYGALGFERLEPAAPDEGTILMGRKLP